MKEIAQDSSDHKSTPQKKSKESAHHAKGTRHDFVPGTRKVIAERSGYRCANPSCGAFTVGPALVSSDGSARVGMAAHIHAASPEGPRYKKDQTEAERKSAENGLWMCETCGKLVDSDESGHTAEELREWKQTAERRAKAELGFANSKALFRLRDGDQTTYINLPRFHEMATAKGFHLTGLPSFNCPLLSSGIQLASIVFALEGVLEQMRLEAVPITHVKNKDQCDAIVGRVVSFKGRFRSSNAPRIRNGDIPAYHPTGDVDRDHVIRKTFGPVELVLPLDSFWYASQSSIGFFRAKGYIPVHGVGRVHRVLDGCIIASPFWMALPNEPLFD